jgi:hypothetical protein
LFFSEEKNQKTLALRLHIGSGHGPTLGIAPEQKFFGSFFQKRTASFLD